MLQDVLKEGCFASRSLRKEESVFSLLKRVAEGPSQRSISAQNNVRVEFCIFEAAF